MNKSSNDNAIIYQTANGAIELKGDYSKETVWASQAQIAKIFGVTPQNITIHIKNIYKQNELDSKSTCKESLQVQIEGERKIKRKIKEYNLDVLISIGYRIDSVIGTKFRQWATKTLKQHITQGYTINKKLLQKNYNLFQSALSDIQKISQNQLSTQDTLELVKMFSKTWFSLEAYDKDNLQTKKQTKKTIQLEAINLYKDIQKLKQELIAKQEATELFSQEKSDKSLEGIFGNIFQTAFQEEVYPSLESKAAHLLYFIVKNHPFNDGNKRTGAFAFIWFLQKTGYDFQSKITPEALTAITLLIATSDPKDKQKMTDLVILLLSGK
jgi:death-on-curing family protein